MPRRTDLETQVKDLQAKLATCQTTTTSLTAELGAAKATISDLQSSLAAAVMDKANLEVELTIEREANATLSDQNQQLRTDLAAAAAEVVRLQALLDAQPPPVTDPTPEPGALDLQSQLQRLD